MQCYNGVDPERRHIRPLHLQSAVYDYHTLHGTFSGFGHGPIYVCLGFRPSCHTVIPSGERIAHLGGKGNFDIVLSLNGFHAFPDKDAAFADTFRVLKLGGSFCGCFFIQGENRRSDWFMDHLYVPKGYFTPPFETRDSLKKCPEGMYAQVKLDTVEAIACFTCRK